MPSCFRCPGALPISTSSRFSGPDRDARAIRAYRHPFSALQPPPYGGDEESAAVLRTVGKVVKMCRERKGLTQAELGAAIGYSEEQVSSVERGRRAPKGQFLEAADQVLGAGGLIAGLRKDVEEARYPKKVRDLAKLEAEGE